MAVWVGGMVAIPLVAVPVLRQSVDSSTQAARLTAGTVRRFHRMSVHVIVLIVLTGVFNLMNMGIPMGFQFGAAFLHLLLVKVGLFLLIVGIQSWQAWGLVPALASSPEPAPDRLRTLYRRLFWTSMLNLALAVIVVRLGLELRYG
jgi:putative copper export protein